MLRRFAALAMLSLLALPLAPARAQLPATIRIGVLNDMSGPYADHSGKGSVIAAQLAADDFAREAGPDAPKIEILSADHQNKADTGAAIVRSWLDRDGVATVVDVPNSAVALAVNQIMRDRDRVFLASSVATAELTGRQCAPTTVQWSFDTWALAHGTVRAIMAQGSKTWFFIAADYALGASLVQDAGDVLRAGGGVVVGDVRAPLGATDFSAYLLEAANSGADVVALANAGSDLVNAVKQSAEFAVARGGTQRLAALLVFIPDIQAMGLDAAQGLELTGAFYWDLNDATRAWSRRFAARDPAHRMPTMNQAGVYSSVLAYLRAATRAGTIAGAVVVKQMRSAPIDDPLFGPTTIRADGRAVHAMYLFRVKTPKASNGPFDLYDLIATIPAADAFRPLQAGGCAMAGG